MWFFLWGGAGMLMTAVTPAIMRWFPVPPVTQNHTSCPLLLYSVSVCLSNWLTDFYLPCFVSGINMDSIVPLTALPLSCTMIKNLLFSVRDLYTVLKFKGHSNPKHVENFLQILIMTLLNSWLCEKLSLPVNRIKRWCAEHNKEEKVIYFFFLLSLQSDIKCVHPILFLACQMLATHKVCFGV